MRLTLFDDGQDFHPLTLTRPVWDLRIGIHTIREKWRRHFGEVYAISSGRLGELFDHPPPPGESLFVSGRCLPNDDFVRLLKTELGPCEGWTDENGCLVAVRAHVSETSYAPPSPDFKDYSDFFNFDFRPTTFTAAPQIRRPADLFLFNAREIREDLRFITSSGKIDDRHTAVYCPENVWVHPTAKIKAAVLDADSGPIYIGPGVQIQIGVMIQGPAAFCDGSVANVGAKIRPETTVGPYCKVGGEISNCVLWGYSNKAHDGFLGNSVLGAWCNLGADTNVSNLKNNYSTVRVRNPATGRDYDTGLLFHGLIMGDHAKSGINVMFNTGTVVGTAANVFGAGFPPKYIRPFAWGQDGIYDVEKAIETAKRVTARRNVVFGPADERLFRALHAAEYPELSGSDKYI
jgi:UDP-N-acetylglucosamine diphosphorylase/glucosamine-1-phosphate N-acetyltransferase